MNRVPAKPRSRNFDYYNTEGESKSELVTSTYVPAPQEDAGADGAVEQKDDEEGAIVVTAVENDADDNHIVVHRGKLKLKKTGTGSLVGDADWDAKDPLQLNVTMKDVSLPVASSTALGGVRIGAGLSIDTNGTLSVSSSGGSYTLPIASVAELGGIRVGLGLRIDPKDGTLSAMYSGYTLPTASSTTLGGIRIGTGLSIDANGMLSATSSGGTNYWALSGNTLSPASNASQVITYGNPGYATTGIRLIGNHVDGWNTGAIGNLYLNADTYTAAPSAYVRIDSGANGFYTGSWSQVSDVRKKGDIEPLEDVLEKVLSLETFHYSPVRDGKICKDIRKLGFSANQVKGLFPELVSEDEEGFYSLDYANMTVLLARAIRELYGMINYQ
jgi:hypothetical protein